MRDDAWHTGLTTPASAILERGPERLDGAPDRRPLGPVRLLVSIIAIAGGTLAVACLGAALAYAALVAEQGRAGASEFLLQLDVDIGLRARLGAAVVSLLYVGLAATTLAAARIVGKRCWRPLVALGPMIAGRRIGIVAAVTLAYGAVATLVLEHLRARHLVNSGPTDYVLAGTIVCNLTLLAPLAEELFFRGWLYTALRSRFSVLPSYLATVALFASIHWDANHRHILFVLPLAAALGVLREATGSIKPTIALHAVYNLVIVALTLWQT